MSRSANSSTGSGFAYSDASRAAEYKKAVILYILGLDGAQQHLYEVDDVVGAIHASFYYLPMDEDRFIPAHGYFMKKHSAMLKFVYRKANTEQKLINGAQDNV